MLLGAQTSASWGPLPRGACDTQGQKHLAPWVVAAGLLAGSKWSRLGVRLERPPAKGKSAAMRKQPHGRCPVHSQGFLPSPMAKGKQMADMMEFFP